MFVVHLAVTSVTVSRWVAVTDEVFFCLLLVRAEENRPWHKYSARLTRTVRNQSSCNACVLYSSRDISDKHFFDSYGWYGNERPTVTISWRFLLDVAQSSLVKTWFKFLWELQRSTLGEYLRVGRLIVQSAFKLRPVKIVENEFWVRTKAGLNTKTFHKMCNVWRMWGLREWQACRSWLM